MTRNRPKLTINRKISSQISPISGLLQTRSSSLCQTTIFNRPQQQRPWTKSPDYNTEKWLTKIKKKKGDTLPKKIDSPKKKKNELLGKKKLVISNPAEKQSGDKGSSCQPKQRGLRVVSLNPERTSPRWDPQTPLLHLSHA